MTSSTPLNGPDFIPGESFEEHLRRHGCVLSHEEWVLLAAQSDVLDARDPQYEAAGIADAHGEALIAIARFRDLIAASAPASLFGRDTAPTAFTAFALREDGLNENALLLAAADAHQELAGLLQWAVDVTRHDDEGQHEYSDGF